MYLYYLKLTLRNNAGSKLRSLDQTEIREYCGTYTEDGQAPGPFTRFLEEHRVVTQYTMPGSPFHNDVAERRNWTLMDVMQSMLSNSKPHKSLWTEAFKTAL